MSDSGKKQAKDGKPVKDNAQPAVSLGNINSPDATVVLSTTDKALKGKNDSVQITLSNVVVKGLTYESAGQISGKVCEGSPGIESMKLISTGSANSIGALNARGLQSLTISGDQKLNLSDNSIGVQSPTAPAQSDATHFAPAFTREINTLALVDASALNADLSISFGAEVIANSFKFLGGAGNDTVRLLGGIDPTGDTFDGGAGTNTLVVGGNLNLVGSGHPEAVSTLKNFQALEIRTGADAGAGADVTTVNASLVGGLQTITVRNEGQTQASPGSPWVSAAESATINLTKLSAAQAANITVLHGTTGNNATGSTVLNATLATNTGSDTIGVTLKGGVNSDQRFNFTLNAGNSTTNKVENLIINDADNESNTVKLGNAAQHTGTITVTGGAVHQFLNLDATVNAGRVDQSGSPLPAAPADLLGDNEVGLGAAERLTAATIESSTYLGDVIVRLGEGNHTIKMGIGDDVVIFDALSTVAAPQLSAGLTSGDVLDGGGHEPGRINVMAIDGDVSLLPVAMRHMSIGASELSNIKNFQGIFLLGNAGITSASALGEGASDMGGNAYNVTLTNAFITSAALTDPLGISRVLINNDDDQGYNGDAGNFLGKTDTPGIGHENGVTVDARSLITINTFIYNGQEGNAATNDRFILSDANVFGALIIDGGALFATVGGVYAATGVGNNDILEVRNSASIALGDLANVRNIGTLAFTNDTAVNQSTTLLLNNTTVDNLVNSFHTASTTPTAADPIPVERLTIHAIDNRAAASGTTQLNLDASAVGSAFGLDVLLGRGVNSVTGSAGADVITLLGNYATGTYAGVRDGGNVATPIASPVSQDSEVNINALANNVAGNRAVSDVINGGAGIDILNTYGNIDLSAATISNIEGITAHSNVVLTAAEFNAIVASAAVAGVTDPVFTFAGEGTHTLSITGTGTVDLSKVLFADSHDSLLLGAGVIGNGAPIVAHPEVVI